MQTTKADNTEAQKDEKTKKTLHEARKTSEHVLQPVGSAKKGIDCSLLAS